MLQFPLGSQRLRRIIALGSHSDDIEIGCGGTLLALTRARPDVDVTWVVLGAEGDREQEARTSAEVFLRESALTEIEVHGFRDGFFPYIGGEIKDVFEELKRRLEPDLILTHARSDLHQDHRLVCELTWNTWRDHLIFEYEIPKYDGDLGSPNVFVPLSKELAEEKARLVVQAFPTQSGKHWFDDELFLGLMRVRGMEAGAPSGYAEAFTCRKLSFEVE